MADNIAQHFRPSEQTFIAQGEDFICQALDVYRAVLSDFLNPRQIHILTTIVNRQTELKFKTFGGYEGAESQRMLIFPSYYEATLADFDMTLLEVNYPTKFAELHHSTILGALIHSGIERSSIGDILADDTGRWQIILTNPIARFVMSEVDHIGKNKVRFIDTPFEQVIATTEDWETSSLTVSSLRLDTIVANGYNISRTHAKELVERGAVRVNWTDIDRPDFMLAVNDLISVRKFGRLKLMAENGLTKKDKWRVEMAVIKK